MIEPAFMSIGMKEVSAKIEEIIAEEKSAKKNKLRLQLATDVLKAVDQGAQDSRLLARAVLTIL